VVVGVRRPRRRGHRLVRGAAGRAFPAPDGSGGRRTPTSAAIVALAPTSSSPTRRRTASSTSIGCGLRASRHVTKVRCLAAPPGSLSRLAVALGAPTAGAPLLRDRSGARCAHAPTGVGGWRAPSGATPRADGGPDEGWWVLGRDTYGADLLATGLDVVPSEPEGRYPRGARFAEVVALAPELVLLPDEPYAFGESDAEELAVAGALRLVDGTALWWWGPRTPARAATSQLARRSRRVGR
jgi:hypothetical protein